MRIRLMTIEDYDAVYKLWCETEGMGIRKLDDSLEGIQKFLDRNPTSNFLCEDGDQIIGTILCGHDGRRGYIYHAMVKASFGRQGIGSKLVDAVKKALEEAGIHKVGLVVYADNHIGNDFWAKEGFVLRDDLIYRNLLINANNI